MREASEKDMARLALPCFGSETLEESSLDAESQGGQETAESRSISRRAFLKWTAAAGIAAGVTGLGALSTLGYVSRPPAPPPPWEIAPGVVDYATWESKLEGQLSGPTPNVLKVAQWYDYWPGSFITDFIDYMKSTYGLTVDVQVDIYTSNEELFEWITLGGKKYDVMFPTNHIVDNIKKGGFIYNLNLNWLPNFQNLWSDFIRVPHGVDSEDNLDQRRDPEYVLAPGETLNQNNSQMNFVGLPYFFGTTGIAFRVDKIPKADVEAVGLDFFTMPSYTPSNGWPTVTLQNNMRMLDDERDVFTFGFKKAGQLWQKAQGTPFSPYTQDYTDTAGIAWKGTQWTSNETDPTRVNAMGNWLLQVKPNLFEFNSTGDVPSLIAGLAVLNQAWSGDITFAQRPDQSNPQPADFVVPYQGSRWWEDMCTIHSQSRNLWLAHQFINFIHNVASPWPENQLLTRWNLYPTPNKACFDWLASNPFPNGYNMTMDPRLYPNLLAHDDWARCDIPRDVGTSVLLNEYNPIWFELTSG